MAFVRETSREKSENENHIEDGAWNLQSVLENAETSNDFTNNFNLYLQNFHNKSSYKFDFREFSKCANHELITAMNMIVNVVFTDLGHIQRYRNIYKQMYQIVVKNNDLVKTLEDTLSEMFQREENKIKKNENWNEILVFGLFLVEIYKVQVIPSHIVKKWIVILLPKVNDGNIKAEIAFLSLLKRISNESKFTSSKVWKRYLSIVKKMAGFKEEIKTNEDEELCNLQHTSESWEISTPENQDKEHEETLAQIAINSAICKSFQATLDGVIKFDNNKFEYITLDEIEVCVRMMVDKVATDHRSINHLTTVVFYYQNALTSLRSFVSNVVKECMKEIETFEKKNFETMEKWHFLNYANFFGELYVLDWAIFGSRDMKNWIETLIKINNAHSIDALIITMKICGRKLKIDDRLGFDEYLNFLKDITTSSLHKQIIQDIEAHIIEDENNGVILDLPGWTRQLQNTTTGYQRMLTDFRSFLRLLNRNDKTAKFDYMSLIEKDHGKRKMDARALSKNLLDKNANVVAFAKFLKDLYMLSYQFGDFIKILKRTFSSRIKSIKINLINGQKPKNEVYVNSEAIEEAENLNTLRNIGIFIAHLTNLLVIDKGNLNEIIAIFKTNVSYDNIEFCDVCLNILNVALIGMQLMNNSNFATTLDRLGQWHLKLPTLQYKIDIIKRKFKNFEIPKNFIETISKAKRCYTPFNTKITEFDNNENSWDLAEIYFLNAISHPLMSEYFAKFLSVMFEKDFKSKIINLCQKNFVKFFGKDNGCKIDEFDKNEAIGTVTFIAHMTIQKLLTEKICGLTLNTLDKAIEKSKIAQEAVKILIDVIKNQIERNELKCQLKDLGDKLRTIEMNELLKQREISQSTSVTSDNIFDKATNMKIKMKFLQFITIQPTVNKKSVRPNDPFYEFANALFHMNSSTVLIDVALKLLPLEDLNDKQSLEKYVVIAKDYIYRNPENANRVRQLICLFAIIKNNSKGATVIFHLLRDRIFADIFECNEAFKDPHFFSKINDILIEQNRIELVNNFLSRIDNGKNINAMMMLLNLLEQNAEGRKEISFRQNILLKLKTIISNKLPTEIEIRLKKIINSIEHFEDENLNSKPIKEIEAKSSDLNAVNNQDPQPSTSNKHVEKSISPASSSIIEVQTPSTSKSSTPQHENKVQKIPNKYQLIASENAEFHRRFTKGEKIATGDETIVRFKEILKILNINNARSLARTVTQNEFPQERLVCKYAFVMKEFLYQNPDLADALKKFTSKLNNKGRLKMKMKDFVEYDIYDACSHEKLIDGKFINGIKSYFNNDFIFLIWKNILEYVCSGYTKALITLIMFMNGNEKIINTRKKRKHIDEFLVVLKAHSDKNNANEVLKRVIKSLETMKNGQPVASDNESNSEDETESIENNAPKIKNYRTVGMTKYVQELKASRPTTKRRPKNIVPNPYRQTIADMKNNDSSDESDDLRLSELRQTAYSDGKSGVTHAIDFGNTKKDEDFSKIERIGNIFDGLKIDMQFKPVANENLGAIQKQPRHITPYDQFKNFLNEINQENAFEVAVKIKPTLLKTDEDLFNYSRMIVDFGYKKPEMAKSIEQLLNHLKTVSQFSCKKLKLKIENCFQYDLIGMVEKKNPSLLSIMENYCKFFIGLYNTIKDAFIFKQWRYLLCYTKEENQIALEILIRLMENNEHIMFNTTTRKIHLKEFTNEFDKQLLKPHPEQIKKRMIKVLGKLNNPSTSNNFSKYRKIQLDSESEDEDSYKAPIENSSNIKEVSVEIKSISIQEFKEILNNISSKSLEFIETSAFNLKVSSQNEMKEIAELFYKITFKSNEFHSHIAIAKIIDEKVKISNPNVSFEKAFVEIFCINFLKLCADYDKVRKTAENDFIKVSNFEVHNQCNKDISKMSRFYGYLFNHDLIGFNQLVTLIDEKWLKHTGASDIFEIIIIFNILEVSIIKILKTIRNGKAENHLTENNHDSMFNENCNKLVNIYESLRELSIADFFGRDLYNVATELVIVREVINFFEVLKDEIKGNSSTNTQRQAEIERKVDPLDMLNPEDKFKYILDNLNNENLQLSVKQILKLNDKQATIDFSKIIIIFTKKCEKDDENLKLAMKLMKHVKAQSVDEDSSAFIKEFTKYIHDFFFKSLISSNLNTMDAFKIVHLICKLYYCKIINLSKISIYIENFFSRGEDFVVSYDCIFILLESTGADFRLNKPHLLENYMKFFREYYCKYEDNGVFGSISKDLLEMEANDWTLHRRVKMDIIDAYLCNNVSISTLRLRILEDEIQPNEFIQTVWKNLMINPQNAIDLSEAIFDGLALFDDNYVDYLNEFIELRRQAFLQIPKESYNRKIHEKLKFFIIFILELYNLGILTDDLDKWIHPRLIEKFENVNDKIEISRKLTMLKINHIDKRSEMFMKNLDNSIADNQMKNFKDIKKELNELEKIMANQSK
ncbi:hypothetical protein PVAND_003488 [Polypedilum vanderplanki]|uniref:Uncharacterized protein n=1 Tax=Polypedilum vanderplanki TaxID=319348 RepID=A0A9J6BUP1_POLVA|nr:hypothetical protein PVAND_003488 [Polypedilum vanderplanki]